MNKVKDINGELVGLPQVSVDMTIVSNELVEEKVINDIVGTCATSFYKADIVTDMAPATRWTLAMGNNPKAIDVRRLIMKLLSGIENPEKVGRDLAELNMKVSLNIEVKDMAENFLYPSIFLDNRIVKIMSLLNSSISINVEM